MKNDWEVILIADRKAMQEQIKELEGIESQASHWHNSYAKAEQQIKEMEASNSDRQLRLEQCEDELKQALKK